MRGEMGGAAAMFWLIGGNQQVREDCKARAWVCPIRIVRCDSSSSISHVHLATVFCIVEHAVWTSLFVRSAASWNSLG